MQAKDIMSPEVVTISSQATVSEIAEMLLDKKISAVPVLDDNEKLVGIVSEGDLIRRISSDGDDGRSWWLKLISSEEDKASEFIKAHGRTATDVMTRNVVTVNEDSDLSEVARTLESHRIKRVPVVSGGKLVGIVSRSNLLQVVAGDKTEVKKPATATDRDIRTQVHDILVSQGFVSHGSLNVIVDDGVVELWGWVESEPERKAMLLAAAEVDGVKEVRDHFGKMSPWVWGS